jgi:virginiamycin B lyase
MLVTLLMTLAFGASLSLCQGPVLSLVSRRMTEYLLPVATETHEFARVPNTSFVLLSQLSDSTLVKIQLDPTTEEPIAYQSFPMGKNSSSGLHGVWPSTKYPGKMWLSLQFDSKLLLVDPGADLTTPPTILQTIDIPQPGYGPHCVFEIGNRVWAGLKVPSPQTGGYYVFSANLANASNTKLYPCLNSPVFIKEEPTSGLIYATQDTASSIMRINLTDDSTTQLPIPASVGNTPVGMTTTYGAGTFAGVWFVLAGNKTGGTGTFGHIGSSGVMTFFSLKKPQLGTNAGLLHVADASTTAGGPALWLLSTSLLSLDSPDALIRVTFDAGITNVTGEEYVGMMTQNAMCHRVVPLDSTVLVSQLNTFGLAQLKYNNTVAGQWLPAEAGSITYDQAG